MALRAVQKGVRLLLRDPAQFFAHLARLPRLFLKPRHDYDSRLDMTIREWLIHHQTSVVFKSCSWFGVPAYKNPTDAWIYQELIHRVQPDVLVEIGSRIGGSTLYFAHLFDLIGKGEVVSVDIDRADYIAEHPRIQLVTGDSSSEEVVSRVREICDGKTVMVCHDGDHKKEQVLKDMAQYAPLVTLGSYLIIEDSFLDLFRAGDGVGVMHDGPLKAIEEFIRTHPDFQVDQDCERYLLTYNPKGYLKRIA